MPLSLNEWQEYVELHFEELARARHLSGNPLFALVLAAAAEGTTFAGQREPLRR